MKVQALITVAAIAWGSVAIAQQNDTYSTRDHQADKTAQADPQDQGKTGSKIGGAIHRLGDKTRHAFHRVGNAIHRTASKDRDDARAMGASGSSDDHGRQARIDQAYANWQAKQEKNR